MFLLNFIKISKPLPSSQPSVCYPKTRKSKHREKMLVKTATGLEYEDTIVGTGAQPKPGQKIRAHYTGKLVDGTVFDSSHKRGTPLEFIVGIGQVIKGWDEGLLSMRVGGTRRLIIPAELGYGSRTAGSIPPNSTLIFEVELVEVL